MMVRGEFGHKPVTPSDGDGSDLNSKRQQGLIEYADIQVNNLK
jgi:hypothetical protein